MLFALGAAGTGSVAAHRYFSLGLAPLIEAIERQIFAAFRYGTQEWEDDDVRPNARHFLPPFNHSMLPAARAIHETSRSLDVLAATSGNYFCIGLNDLALTAEEKEDYRYRSRGSRHSGERLRSYCANELTNPRPTEVRGRGRGWVNLNVK